MFSSLLLAAATAQGTPAAYPAQDVLSVFEHSCTPIADFDKATALAEKAGWKTFDAVPDSKVGQLIAFGRRAMERMGTDMEVIEGGTYRREVSGRDLYMVISGVRGAGFESRGCRIYDFDAAAPIGKAELTEWAGREPSSDPSENSPILSYGWEPGLTPDHTDMEVIFAEQDADLPGPLAELPLSGLVFSASIVELTDQ
ncbi:hypothetical protein D6851_07800 [Altericroceibacterium spongiae]|uniref:Uncharacterized protein n=1 Tax=Altericroceibacterium spongiae TaxID=2320269 RepID=A0A420EMF4_9SPHN|nr:hypothetical protein [Altericroceibacterium spongiae]RKF21907.1 hypothetical protein D6851_07800 [Altericroceibacterium spongiae]